MMKRLLFISALSLTIFCNAETALISVTVDGHSVSQKIDLASDEMFGNYIKSCRLFLDEEVACDISIVSRSEHALDLKVKVYAKNKKGDLALVAEPALLAVWDEEAKVTMSNPDNFFSMTVVVSKQ